MKKKLYIPLILVIAVALISWGGAGHRTIATIAENHLTPQARAGIRKLIGDTSLADIASWADEVRSTPAFAQTGPWHYANVPSGYSYEQFSNAIKNSKTPNVYTAVLKCEHDLKSDTTSQQYRAYALKFVVHFVGDLHQPMHVSHAEDQGGNQVPVIFNGNPTNLHSLWDSGLINQQHMSVNQMATAYDRATPEQIAQWQSDDMMKWLYESYLISEEIYKQAKKNSGFGQQYFTEAMPIVQKRILQAGIRLAGVLNEVFKNTVATDATAKKLPAAVTAKAETEKSIELADAPKHIGQKVSITGKVYSSRDMGSMYFLNLGAEYPNQLMTVVLRDDAKDKGKDLNGKTVSVTGTVVDFKGKPEIVVTDVSMITIAK